MTTNEIKKLNFSELSFAVIDFETTGMSPGNSRVIEVGIVIVEELKIKKTFSTLINPGRDIPYFISKLTGISNRDVENAPYFDEVADSVFNLVKDKVIVAHNVPFDIPFLKSELRWGGINYTPENSLCTLKLSRKLFPDLKSKSLSSVTNYLGVRHKDVHRALGDATVTAKILIKMLKLLEDKLGIADLDNLMQFLLTSTSDAKNKYGKSLTDGFLNIPDSPGVYFFKNEKNKIYYIGKAKSLRKRIKSHFSTSSHRKSKKIVNTSDKLEFIETNSELSALLAEAELIKIHNPRFNSMLKKFGNTYFLKIQKDQLFPSLKVVNEFLFDGNDYFGPFAQRELPNELLEIVNKTFQIRSCSEKLFNKMKPCYLSEIEMCLAPCKKDFDPVLYEEELNRVYSFLSGKNQDAVDILLGKMQRYSERKEFEKAAEIRDLIQRILKQVFKFATISEPVNKANILIEIKEENRNDFLLLCNGKIYLKNDPVNGNAGFEQAFEVYKNHDKEYYINAPEERDLERLKILMSWLVKNKDKFRIK